MRTLGGDGGGEGSREAALSPRGEDGFGDFPRKENHPGGTLPPAVQGAEHPARPEFRRQLHRHAMQAAVLVDQRQAINADNFPVWETGL